MRTNASRCARCAWIIRDYRRFRHSLGQVPERVAVHETICAGWLIKSRASRGASARFRARFLPAVLVPDLIAEVPARP